MILSEFAKVGPQESFDRGTQLRNLKRLFALTRVHASTPEPAELQKIALRLGQLDSHHLVTLLIEARRAGAI